MLCNFVVNNTGFSFLYFRLRGIDDPGHADDLVRGRARFSDPERGRPGHSGGPLLLQATRRNPEASP